MKYKVGDKAKIKTSGNILRKGTTIEIKMVTSGDYLCLAKNGICVLLKDEDLEQASDHLHSALEMAYDENKFITGFDPFDKPIPKWEYHELNETTPAYPSVLNGLGKKGWELVSLVRNPDSYHSYYYLFKRQA